jgi:hypothetical protein
VRGVASQDHAAGAEAAGEAGIVGIDALADQFDIVRVVHHLRQQAAHDLGPAQGFLGFTRHHHELKAPDAVRQGGGDVRALGVAMHGDVGGANRIVADIHHHPLVGRGLAVEGDALLLAHAAAAAVACHQVGGAQDHRFARGAGGGQRDACLVLGEVAQGVGEQHPDVGEPGQPLVQDAVGHGLDEGVAARPAEFVGPWLD